MRKILLLLIIISFSCFYNTNAQSLAGYKIYVNPGHGGHDSNDREIPLDNGITYWESEGNLTKGLYLKTMLENLGATVIMSRVTNTSADDYQPTSQIAAMANASNADYFHAIHSNATGTSTKANYTLILFQGKTTVPTYPASLTMANYLATNINKANRTVNKMVYGDYDFYGTGQPYLGVFINLNMPGTLSEGSFHDYTPETWRLKNDSYLKHEAWAIARSFLQYFNGGTYQHGIIAGIVRDAFETVPSSYSPLGGTLDNFKAINNIKVTLNPGNKIYNGDTFNNGYYMFDELTPGDYTVIVEAANMRPDTSTVTAKSNESVFSDRMMALNPILDPPNIISYAPSDSLNAVSNISPIVIEFDIRMNTAETQNAFSISPNVTGSFKWNTDYKKLTFTPAKSYVAGTKYTVIISKSAKTFFGIKLQNQKSFNFTTRSTLNLTYTYPKINEVDVSTSVLIDVKFEKPIDGTTLGGRISLTDNSGNTIGVTVKNLGAVDGLIEFEPKVPLMNNSLYRITLKAGIGDIEYVTFPTETVIEFRTEHNYIYSGSTIEAFESNNIWQSPILSANTQGVVTDQTNFTVTPERKKGGDNSGKLEYGFTGSTGLVDLSLLNPLTLIGTSQSEIGMWVFGDNSKNILEFRFNRQTGGDVNVKVDTLNWTGWKFKKILFSNIPGTGTLQFKGMNVLQTAVGNIKGKIFLDDCISNVVTDVQNNYSLPVSFKLEQNYPNPFNPSTVISYQLPAFSYVTLKIYDVLGREVSTLVDENKMPGKYKVIFNAHGLASGVYLYRLQAGSFIETKKLLLLK